MKINNLKATRFFLLLVLASLIIFFYYLNTEKQKDSANQQTKFSENEINNNTLEINYTGENNQFNEVNDLEETYSISENNKTDEILNSPDLINSPIDLAGQDIPDQLNENQAEPLAEVKLPGQDKTPVSAYPIKKVMTTYFWVGEKSGEDNNYISNKESYWDENWQDNFGGVDSPEDRCGYFPCAFTPNENPFYFALPYGEYDDGGELKENIKKIPWYGNNSTGSIIKNRWIEVKYQGRTCYAQWEDVGPMETDDFNYVFGDGSPKSSFNNYAGLDISPAVWDCLNMNTNDITEWRFIEETDVPAGPWKEIITY
ncbi:MAG: hypothetical protein ABH830_02800 [Patescibacteria group bacterium]